MTSTQANPAPTTASLFRLLSEFSMLLLGALLVLLAFTRTVRLPAHPSALVVVGVLCLYSGIRAGMRREPEPDRLQTQIRAGSLVLVGLLVLAIPLLPLRHSNVLLGAAGSVLVLRGLIGAVLSFKKS